jgi:hypothetical protein
MSDIKTFDIQTYSFYDFLVSFAQATLEGYSLTTNIGQYPEAFNNFYTVVLVKEDVIVKEAPVENLVLENLVLVKPIKAARPAKATVESSVNVKNS